MGRPKKGASPTRAIFKNAAVYEPTKREIDVFAWETGMSIAEALKRIVPMGVRAYYAADKAKAAK